MADINKSRGLDEGKTQGNEVRLRTDGSSGDLTLKIDVDVSEALTGLKAVQREAKAATKALRGLEAVSPADLGEIPTEDLTRELALRSRVREYTIVGKECLALRFEEQATTVDIVGPARILVHKLIAPVYTD